MGGGTTDLQIEVSENGFLVMLREGRAEGVRCPIWTFESVDGLLGFMEEWGTEVMKRKDG